MTYQTVYVLFFYIVSKSKNLILKTQKLITPILISKFMYLLFHYHMNNKTYTYLREDNDLSVMTNTDTTHNTCWCSTEIIASTLRQFDILKPYPKLATFHSYSRLVCVWKILQLRFVFHKYFHSRWYFFITLLYR